MITGIGEHTEDDRDPVETTVCTVTYMRSQDFVDELNTNITNESIDTSEWKNWRQGKDGYPTLEE